MSLSPSETGLLDWDGHDYPGTPGFYTHVGAFLVKPGCTLSAWEQADYEGEFRQDYVLSTAILMLLLNIVAHTRWGCNSRTTFC